MKKVILYIRVSTDEQADTGYSQRSQQEMLTRYCQLQNFTVVATFFEDHSAKTFERPEFKKILFMLHKHKRIADLVLFTKWDRFSRNAGDAYGMINRLNKLGVEPQAIEQPLNLEIPENKMMLAFYLSAPEVENDRRALNTINGMRRAQKEGRFMGKAPFGYSNKTGADGKTKSIVVNETEAAVISWIFEQLATGKFTAESIYHAATERGFYGGKHKYWIVLRSPVYCGKIKLKRYKTEEEMTVAGQHKAIISRELFYQVQEIIDGRKKVQRVPIKVDDKFPLRGHLICPNETCGRMLTASASRGRKIYYEYYHCCSGCGTRYKAKDVHDQFASELRKWKLNPAIAELYKIILKDVYTQQRSDNTQTMQEIKKEITRLTDRQIKARELLLSDALDSADFRQVKNECEQGIILQEQKLADLTTVPDIEMLIDKGVNVLSHIDELYAGADTITKRHIVGSMFPENLLFNGEHYRTSRMNEAVKVIFNLGTAFETSKKGQEEEFSALSLKGCPTIPFSNLFLIDLKKLAALAA
jgi:site-specific DNA recombinase